MSTELLTILVGGPGLVALVVAVIGFAQNRRTLQAAQPKTEAEKMGIDISNLRSLLEETRQARESDRQDFQYRIAELKAELKEQQRRYEQRIAEILDRVEVYLQEHAIGRPSWWPRRHDHKHPDDQG